MPELTLYLAKAFGLFILIACGAFAARPRSALIAVKAVADQPGTLLTIGVFTLAIGVACVLGHTLWRSGALAAVVTLLGWATLLKGVLLLATPPRTLKAIYRALHYPQTFRWVMAGGVVFGAALTIAAFSS